MTIPLGQSHAETGVSQPLLVVRGLQTRFRVRDTTVYAVEGASFSIGVGETLGIVGESGSGKSVTALSIMGMIRYPGRIAGGEVLFHGENLLTKSDGEMRKLRGRTLAMVPQNPLTSLNPVLTVGDHLREVLWVHLGMGETDANKRAAALLQRVGLPDPQKRLRDFPHRMSGGQRQRVMIALAMACEPELLIADEPTTALDVTIQSQILELMDQLARESHLTSILITHNLGIVAGHCDHVVVMYAGRVVEAGPVDEIFAHPRHPYTVGLLRCVPRLTRHRDSNFETILGSPPIVSRIATGCPFAPRCQNVTAYCQDHVPELTEMGPRHVAACWNPMPTSDGTGAQPGLAGQSQKARVATPAPIPIASAAAPNGHAPSSQGVLPELALSSAAPLVDVEDILVHYNVQGEGFLIRRRDTLRAVDGVSFDIQEGETLGLVGESGCGKSTTGRATLFLERPTGGVVRFRGQDLGGLTSEQLRSLRRYMQVVFQDPYASLDPRMTIGQIINEPLSVHHLYEGKKRKDRIAELLSMVELNPDFVQRYPHEFSGGQRQRIGIARAIAVEPSFIVLDEPVSALDVSIQAQILSLLTNLQQRLNLSYLFIAHDLAVVGQMCDRVAVMYLGKIVELAARDEVYQRPHHPYTQALFSAVPIPDPAIEHQNKRMVLGGEVPSPINPPKGCRFHPRCPLAQDICRVEEPPLRQVQSRHEVACHFAEEAVKRFDQVLV